MNIGIQPRGPVGPDPFDSQLLQALRQLPDAEPPADFARGVAMQAERRASVAERWLVVGALLAFVPAAGYAAARYGDAWIGSFAAVLPQADGGTVINWLAATGACLALSWVVGRVRPGGSRR